MASPHSPFPFPIPETILCRICNKRFHRPLFSRVYAMQPKTEQFLNLLLWSAEMVMRPTFRNVTESYEGWAYRKGLFDSSLLWRSFESSSEIKAHRRIDSTD